MSTGLYLADEFLLRHYADKGINGRAFLSFIQAWGDERWGYLTPKWKMHKPSILRWQICALGAAPSTYDDIIHQIGGILKTRLMFISTKVVMACNIFLTLRVQVDVTLSWMEAFGGKQVMTSAFPVTTWRGFCGNRLEHCQQRDGMTVLKVFFSLPLWSHQTLLCQLHICFPVLKAWSTSPNINPYLFFVPVSAAEMWKAALFRISICLTSVHLKKY